MPEGMKPPEKIQPKTLGDYLDVMSKSVFQSGMSWKVVEAKWDGTRDAFMGFDVDRVADKAGFGTATLLRHHFRRVVGVNPSDYRRRFACPNLVAAQPID